MFLKAEPKAQMTHHYPSFPDAQVGSTACGSSHVMVTKVKQKIRGIATAQDTICPVVVSPHMADNVSLVALDGQSVLLQDRLQLDHSPRLMQLEFTSEVRFRVNPRRNAIVARIG